MNQELFEAAMAAMENAYCPYSGYRVGAAVRTADGRIFSGCNIENAAYGATVCAERVAMFKAVSENAGAILEMVLVAGEDGFPSPCGTCRQVMAELAPDAVIRAARHDGEYRSYRIPELLPDAFTLETWKEEDR